MLRTDTTPSMNNIGFIADIFTLPVQKGIQLVELIWDSVITMPEAVTVSPECKAKLESRLKEFKATPEAGYSWEQVKFHLKANSWHSA